VTPLADTVDQLLPQLPDPRTAQLLFDRLISENKALERTFTRDAGLLSDVLTLAAWSPLLATTLENNPDYVSWLQRERAVPRVRTPDELGESLGRFALINSQLNPHVMLARFRRRELLRIYLHDIRRTRTIVETTDELSSLADAILEYALKLCRQDLDNRYGTPQTTDPQCRILSAEFCVLALGKLGSSELNYASDIDLIFLFSQEGMTSIGGARGQISNREYFVKLAEQLLKVVGDAGGEGASYRIDARLRPHGREGALACSVDEAVNYYQGAAADWELQALIRARSAAGSDAIYSRFSDSIEDQVYRPNIGVGDALRSVREAKEKIDIQHERPEKGFNVKLGHGGIREIEFIAQALQLAFGGDDPWLRTAHTLVTLGRLRERHLITEREHSQLSDAYHFLRALEHRLQMEHGLQTHSVPRDERKRELLARRMNFATDATMEFEAALRAHTAHVRRAFERIFSENPTRDIPTPRPALIDKTRDDASAEIAVRAAEAFGGDRRPDGSASVGIVATLEQALASCSNRARATTLISRIAAAFAKEPEPKAIQPAQLRTLIQLCSASEFFGEMIASRPSLVHVLPVGARPPAPRDYAAELREALADRNSFAEELAALRLKWSELLVEIGAHDAAGTESLSRVNELLTNLATAGADASLVVARRELQRRYGALADDPRLAVLGLGRLGSGGMDYGSDLDIVIVYDSAGDSPVNGLTSEEAYARLIEYFVAALSSITREGVLYRVDLRLRPDGQKGPLATSSAAFIDYVERRAAVWEWLAYVKLRAVAGDLEFGRTVETAARRRIHELARKVETRQLATETRRVRDRLQKAKRPRRQSEMNIKHGIGGMLDVYFAVRYLQLRDGVADDGEDRTTRRMLQVLREAGSISEENFDQMFAGYRLLRSVDHQLRLTVGRLATVPPPDAAAFIDIARRLGYETANQLHGELVLRMRDVRQAYDSIVTVN
jgi:[glutamine synthetase] adenylyltransferase / [glutamine synthetase]-adenylyl-L-tyrosine phosphorylase